MSRRTDSFDLGRLSLSSGEGRQLELEALVDPFTFGGQRYGVADRTVDVVVDVSHTTSGYALRLRFDGQLEGPCMRCLGEAAHTVTVDAREIDQPGDDDELRSPYLEEQELDLRGWVRDSLALALPTQIICRAECLGLCGVCGVNLNEAGPEHRHDPAPDPRWQALRELRLD